MLLRQVCGTVRVQASLDQAIANPSVLQHLLRAPLRHENTLVLELSNKSAQRVVRCSVSSPTTTVVATQEVQTFEQAVDTQVKESDFFYDGVVFDMDGTLTEAHIDFADMRARTEIPVGDLFTVMEAWSEEPERIDKAMSVILDIEAEAASRVSTKTGLEPLLQLLKDKKVKVALVTRNTTASVKAFLDLIGPEWSSVFSIILTREFDFVKPDKRLLLHVAKEWAVDPSRLLMVGDSLEDVEVGNAAGTATCLVAGGGNEKPGSAPTVPPPGADPTFSVTGLDHLATLLEQASDQLVRDRQARLSLEQAMLSSSALDSVDIFLNSNPDATAATTPASTSATSPAPSVSTSTLSSMDETSSSGSASGAEAVPALTGSVKLGWPARLSAGDTLASEGAPPPGLSFLDWLVGQDALKQGATSFPVMGEAAGGLATCSQEQRGDRLLHVGCGKGALTKMMASQGMQVVGIDADVSAAQKRGLQAVAWPASGRPLTTSSLAPALAHAKKPFDVVFMCTDGASPDSSDSVPEWWWSGESLREIQSVMHPGSRLCAQVSLMGSSKAPAVNPAVIINSINSSGMTVTAWQLMRTAQDTAEPTVLRIVAQRHRG